MIDIYMKNAHPTLLLSYCYYNNIPSAGIYLYINNREELMKQYIEINKASTDDAKKYLLLIMKYKWKINNLKQEVQERFVLSYNGMRIIIDSVWLLNLDLYELAEKHKSEKGTKNNIK